MVCHLYFLVSACMCKFLMHKLVIYMHEHNHGTPSGCPHKHILYILATTSLACPIIRSQGAHWVLTWCSLGCSLGAHLGAHLVLTGCSSGAHWVLTGCSLGAHLVLTWCSLGAHLVLTGCSSGAHWVLIDPNWQPGQDASTELYHSSQQ